MHRMFHHNDQNGSGGERKDFRRTGPANSQNEAQITALREAVKTFTIRGPESEGGAKAYAFLVNEMMGIKGKPEEVQKEIIRSLKKISMFTERPVEAFSSLIRAIPDDERQPVIKPVGEALGEMTEFMDKVKNRDTGALKFHMREKTDFEVAAASYLVMLGAADELKHTVLERKDMSEELLFFSVCGLVFNSDFKIMIETVRGAVEGNHPQLKGIVDVFSRELKRETSGGLISLKEIYEDRGQRMTPEALIEEMTKAMHHRMRRNAGDN